MPITNYQLPPESDIIPQIFRRGENKQQNGGLITAVNNGKGPVEEVRFQFINGRSEMVPVGTTQGRGIYQQRSNIQGVSLFRAPVGQPQHVGSSGQRAVYTQQQMALVNHPPQHVPHHQCEMVYQEQPQIVGEAAQYMLQPQNIQYMQQPQSQSQTVQYVQQPQAQAQPQTIQYVQQPQAQPQTIQYMQQPQPQPQNVQYVQQPQPQPQNVQYVQQPQPPPLLPNTPQQYIMQNQLQPTDAMHYMQQQQSAGGAIADYGQVPHGMPWNHEQQPQYVQHGPTTVQVGQQIPCAGNVMQTQAIDPQHVEQQYAQADTMQSAYYQCGQQQQYQPPPQQPPPPQQQPQKYQPPQQQQPPPQQPPQQQPPPQQPQQYQPPQQQAPPQQPQQYQPPQQQQQPLRQRPPPPQQQQRPPPPQRSFPRPPQILSSELKPLNAVNNKGESVEPSKRGNVREAPAYMFRG